MMKTFDELYSRLSVTGNKRIAVANAQGEEVLEALKMAQERFGISAVLLGDAGKIRLMMQEIPLEGDVTVLDYPDAAECAAAAVKMVHDGEADILMKGMIESKVLLQAVINQTYGLRVQDKLIATVAVMELEDRFLFITDPGFTLVPDLHQKEQLLVQTVQLAQRLGVREPKVAVLSAAEVVNPKMISSQEAAILKEKYQENSYGCIVDGPLPLDIAVSKEAAEEKKYAGPVQGDADILLMPSMEMGNVLYKAMIHFAHIPSGGIVTGSSAPIVFTSRSDDAQTKCNTIAFACMLSQQGEDVD